MANNKYSKQPRPKYNTTGGAKKGKTGAKGKSNRKGGHSDSTNN
jgi:hypothetical protein